ncbi:MAG: hypothetical protein JWR83_3174 [Aeromicrobium sp.]|nr:hypothetical protein [Aeromicrobium sp.]
MLTRFRPSPALIVASLALLVATSGTAYATVTIRGSSIADHSISGRKLINNTLTGTQIHESQLATVPHATSAKTVGGITVRKVLYAPKSNSATPTTILHIGGLVLTATCNNGDVRVQMTSTVDHAHLASEMYNSAGGGGADGLHHSDFGPNSAIHLEDLGDGNAWGETSFTYTRANGIIVNGQLSFDSSDLNVIHPGDGDIFNHVAKCLVSGFVTSTTASP